MPPEMNGNRRHYLIPDWPAPAGVSAVSTTRVGGGSAHPFDSFNLGFRSGDDAGAVSRNRTALIGDLGLLEEPRWLRQVHGARVVGDDIAEREPEADASVTSRLGVGCVVLTADCLPVLLSSSDGTRVAAAHAGWRGLAAGVLKTTVDAMRQPGEGIIAWLGPGIGRRAFEVGGEVRDAFVEWDPGCECCFEPSPAGRWLADLKTLAARQLNRLGVTQIYSDCGCTHSEPERFYSYRRDGVTGRMASLIWIDRGG